MDISSPPADFLLEKMENRSAVDSKNLPGWKRASLQAWAKSTQTGSNR
jgi:hypothetical protein